MFGLSFFSRRHAVAIAVAVFIVALLRYRGPELETIREFAHLDGTFGGGWMSQKQFVKRALQDDIYVQKYNGSAVRKVCSNAKWQEGLIVSCDEIAGGIGNLKMRLLGCIRYAIEAGATLVTPVIHPRTAFEKMDKSFAWDTDLPLDYIFDSDHLYATLAEDCPQLRIVNETDTSLNIPPKSEAYKLRPNTLVEVGMGEHLVMNPEGWRKAFDDWLRKQVLLKFVLHMSKDTPIRLSLDEWVQFTWPTDYDGPDFKNDWGRAALIRRDIRELSARALYNLYRRIGCKQSPHTPSKNCFLGAHIRTEGDAKVENWDSYEDQVEHAREQLSTHNLSVLYVATGTASDVDKLKVDLKDMKVKVNETHEVPVQVIQKWDLLTEDDMMVMDNLTWDQMALVDFDIMLRASRFEGIWESSWAWMISLVRNQWSDDPSALDHGTTFEDGLSLLYGPPGAQAFIPPTLYL